MEQNRGGHLKALLLLAAAALLLFAEAVFTDGLPFPVHTDAFRPWSDDLAPDELADVHQKMNRSATDKNLSFHPDNLVTREAFQNGRLPLWNPHQAGGLPHVGQSLYGIFYPLNLPLFLSGSTGWYLWLAVLHYLIAKMASDFVPFLMVGEGADELFAGYPIHKEIQLSQLPSVLIESLRNMHNNSLQRVDRCGTAHGLHTTAPYLDPRVVNFSFRIPPELKVCNGLGKWCLREAMVTVKEATLPGCRDLRAEGERGKHHK